METVYARHFERLLLRRTLFSRSWRHLRTLVGQLTRAILVYFLTIPSTSSLKSKCGRDIDSAKELATPIANLASRIFELLSSENPADNLVFSPISVALSLALLEQGARRETRTELLTVLTDPSLDTFEIGQSYQSLQHQAVVRNAKSANLSLANALFVKQGVKIIDKYSKVIDMCFQAGLMELNNDSEEATRTINEWVSNQTSGNIPSLVRPGSISLATSLVLANAVYLKAAWEKPFHKTQLLTFHGTGGSKEVPFVTETEYYKYYIVGDYQVIDLPYLGNEFTMVIAVKSPPNGSTAGLGTDSLLFTSRASFQREAELLRLELKLPKFQVRSSIDLKDVLLKLGLKTMFGKESNFGGISKDPIYVTEAVHEAFIKVDENGTEASSATAVELGYKSKPSKPIPVVIDRPFTFAIMHNPTGATVFMGRVNKIE